MTKLEALKQVVAQRRTDKKKQLKVAFVLTLSKMVEQILDVSEKNNSALSIGTIIHSNTELLLKEVSIRTDLR